MKTGHLSLLYSLPLVWPIYILSNDAYSVYSLKLKIYPALIKATKSFRTVNFNVLHLIFDSSDFDIWATSWENLFLNKKGADQPGHPCNLFSAVVNHCLDSIIPLVSISETSSLYLASLAAQAGLCLTWSQTPKTGFLSTRLILCQTDVKQLLQTILSKSVLPFLFMGFLFTEIVTHQQIRWICELWHVPILHTMH